MRSLALTLPSLLLAWSCTNQDFAGVSDTAKKKKEKEKKEDSSSVDEDGTDGKDGPDDEEGIDEKIVIAGGGLDDEGDESPGDLGEDGTEADPENGGIGEGGDEACKPVGDNVKFKYPKEIEECLNSGKVYNFYDQACSSAAAATTFECTWAGLEQGVEAFMADPSVPESYRADVRATLEKTRTDGYKLVGCGEGLAPDGRKMIIWQRFKITNPETFDCKYEPTDDVRSTCLKMFDSVAAANAWAAGDVKQRVRECIGGSY